MIARGLRWIGLSIGVATWLALCFYAAEQLAARANDRNIANCRARSGPDARCFTDIIAESYSSVTMLMGFLLIGIIILGYYLYIRRAPARPGESTEPLGKQRLFAPVSVIIATVAIGLVGWLGLAPVMGDLSVWHHHLWLIFMQWLFAGILVRLHDGRAERLATNG